MMMSNKKKIRLAVIGCGLIGTAAARHLSKMGHDVVLIGPGEPQDLSSHDGVFGSHYDEGRMTRRFDPEPFWLQANSAALSRYEEISAESGVVFFREVGVLHVGPRRYPDVLAVGEISAEAGIYCERYNDVELVNRFPFLKSVAGHEGFFEPGHAGYISPRSLVRAQTIAARRAGVQIVSEPVVGIQETGLSVTVRTKSNEVVAERVLVAAGGHTRSLIGQSLGSTVYGRTVALFRLGDAEALRLAGMPSIRYIGPQGEDPYILPPIRYPDGQVWLKIGGDPVDLPLEKDSDVRDWFRSGGSVQVADWLQQQLFHRLRDLKIEERRFAPCMTTYAHTGLPYIGSLSERISVAFSCYGKSAKCSDELGRLGAMALLGEVRAELQPWTHASPVS